MMPINPGPNLSRKRTRKQVLAGQKQHKSSLYLRYLIYFHRKIDCLKCASVFISVLIKNLKNIHTRNGFIDEYDEYDQKRTRPCTGYSGSGWTQAASCYLADPAQNQNAQYQGKYLDSLCFFDMTGYDDQQASSAAGQQFSFELETGGNLSFTLKREGRPLRAATVPTFGGAPLGNMGYKGIGGKPVLYTVEHK